MRAFRGESSLQAAVLLHMQSFNENEGPLEVGMVDCKGLFESDVGGTHDDAEDA